MFNALSDSMDRNFLPNLRPNFQIAKKLTELQFASPDNTEKTPVADRGFKNFFSADGADVPPPGAGIHRGQ